MSTPKNPDTAAAAPAPLAEVRYSLPALLAEVKRERAAGVFAQERFTQGEIEKVFKTRTQRHAKRAK